MTSKIHTFIKVTEEVYGRIEGPHWVPKPYADNKSRYLWTDAFGVCNFITLYYETGDFKYLDAADSLIKNVHDVLGKDRSGRTRLGNATDEEPLKGGLRIGKSDPEGMPDGDGQYFHYLTKWMFALNRMSMARNTPKYNDWAVQMAKSVHPHFVYQRDSNRPRMHWKISIDMSHPVVKSEGNLDPFDGYITYKILQDHCSDKSVLQSEISDFKKIVDSKYQYYRSDDPLDLGESLWISHWFLDEPWAKTVASSALGFLDYVWKRNFQMPIQYRLAFREFGTSIGLQVNPSAGNEWRSRVDQIHAAWANNLYTRDRDITPVMYCSSLIPGVWSKNYETKMS
jgi:hypothetical protein